MTERIDFFGNTATFATIQEPHRQLSVTAINVVELDADRPPRADLTPPWEDGPRPARRRPRRRDVLAA